MTVKHLLIINIIFFIASLSLGELVYDLFALHYPSNSKFQYWQPLTHMFMHGDFGHIFFNMFGLYMFGNPIEQMWGKNKFIFFYFSAGIGAGLIYTLVNYYQFNGIYNLFVNAGLDQSEIITILERAKTTDTRVIEHITQEQFNRIIGLYNAKAVGASGAVYGVLVAFGMYFKDAKLALIFLPIPIAAKYFIPILIAFDVFFGMTDYSIGNIAHFAHIGGALIGFMIAWYWKKNQFMIN